MKNKAHSFSIFRVEIKTRIIMFLIAIVLYIFAAQTRQFKELKKIVFDLRYILTEKNRIAPDIAFVAVDDQQLSINHNNDNATNLLELAKILPRLGAKTVGIDLISFDDDSLTDLFLKNSDSLIIGLPYLQTSEMSQSNPIEINTSNNDFSLENLKSGIAHLFSSSCKKSFFGREVPLLLHSTNGLIPAFGLKLFCNYSDIKPESLAISENFIELFETENRKLRLPTIFYVNCLPDGDSESHFYFIPKDFYTNPNLNQVNLSDISALKNKIAIITRVKDDERSPTLRAHVILLNSLLKNNIINRIERPWEMVLLPGFMFLSLVLLLRLPPLNFLYYLSGLSAVYFLTSILCFSSFNLFFEFLPEITFASILLLIVITREGIEYFGWFGEQQPPAKVTKPLPVELVIPESEKKNPHIKIVIPLVKLRNKCVLTHTIETDWDRKLGITAFHRSPQIKHPFVFFTTNLNQLELEQESMVNLYRASINGKRDGNKPIELLKRIGHKVYRDYGLLTTFDEIFEKVPRSMYLNIVVDDFSIPWHWAYNSKANKFLCDEFPVSFSFAIERAELCASTQNIPQVQESDKTKGVVLLHGNWQGVPEKQLWQSEKEIRYINRVMSSARNTETKICNDAAGFLKTLVNYNETKNLRIIHYTGHIEDDRIEISPDQYLKAGTLSHTSGLSFQSRPIVFLNGCQSGNLGYLWDKYDDLATEFLACGAAACIITQHDIVETTARAFSETFYRYFINNRVSAGEALRLTRIKLERANKKNNYDPDFDITRYFYNLYGDPSVRFDD